MKFAVNEIDDRVANYKRLQTRAAEIDYEISELRKGEHRIPGKKFDREPGSHFDKLQKDRYKVLRTMDIELQLIGYAVIRNW